MATCSYACFFMESLGWEGPQGGLWFNLLPKAGPALGSGQAAQGFLQAGLENPCGWRFLFLSSPMDDSHYPGDQTILLK